MPICESCGKQVHKLSVHSVTKKKLCLKCLIESGSYKPRFDDFDADDEKRGSIRIPITLIMDMELDSKKKKYSAYSADMSMTGICIAWDGCSSCSGYIEKGIHENCILHPYYINNEKRKSFTIQLDISKEMAIQVPAYAVYTLKDENIDIEYVGAKFADLTPAENRMIEQVIISYA